MVLRSFIELMSSRGSLENSSGVRTVFPCCSLMTHNCTFVAVLPSSVNHFFWAVWGFSRCFVHDFRPNTFLFRFVQ